jgi:hypothetical protein
MISPDYVRRACHELLHIDPIEMPGGHSPFLARPAELAAVLLRAATTPEAPTR